MKAAGSKQGVITDLDGKFSIDAAPNATLTITYVGMEPKTVKAQAGKTLTITLKDDSKVLSAGRKPWQSSGAARYSCRM